jgi:hypothetical protein
VDKQVTPFEMALELVGNLSALEKVRLMERIAATLEDDLAQTSDQPLDTLYGIFADLGTAPSAADIDEARREMWGTFPRGDL